MLPVKHAHTNVYLVTRMQLIALLVVHLGNLYLFVIVWMDILMYLINQLVNVRTIFYIQGCSYKCLTCSQNSTNCLTCSDASRKNAPSCDCIVGTYDVNNSAVCKIGINCVMSPVA